MVQRHYKQGDYLFICDQCGHWTYGSDGRMQWNNLFVCNSCYEERQPQDFVRGLPDDTRVPIARPRQTDSFLSAGDVTPEDL